MPQHIPVDGKYASIDGEGSDERDTQPAIKAGDPLVPNDRSCHCRYPKLGLWRIKWGTLNACFYRVKGKGTAPDDTSSDAPSEEGWDKSMLIATGDCSYAMSDQII